MGYLSISEIPGIAATDLEKLLIGELPITPQIALLLEAALSYPAEDFWLRLEANYRRLLAKLAAGAQKKAARRRLYVAGQRERVLRRPNAN